jgi:hypothetical protein
MKSSIVVNPNAFRAELFKCFFHYRRIKVNQKDFICVPAVSDNEYLVSVFKEDEMVDIRYHDQPPLLNAYFNHYMDVKKAVALRSLDPQDYYRYYFAECCYIISLMEKFVPGGQIPVGQINAFSGVWHDINEFPPNNGEGYSKDVIVDMNGEEKDFQVGWYDHDEKRWLFHFHDTSNFNPDKMKWAYILTSMEYTKEVALPFY